MLLQAVNFTGYRLIRRTLRSFVTLFSTTVNVLFISVYFYLFRFDLFFLLLLLSLPQEVLRKVVGERLGMTRKRMPKLLHETNRKCIPGLLRHIRNPLHPVQCPEG